MSGLRGVAGVCFCALFGVASFGQAREVLYSSDDEKPKHPFELRILLDVKQDEVAIQVINRANVEKRIHLTTLDAVGMDLTPVRDTSNLFLGSPGFGFNRRSFSDWPEGRVIRLKPGQSIGLRFSFCRHDFFGASKEKVFKKAEELLKKTKAVRYRVFLRVFTPSPHGEPVEGPRLESNTLFIDRATLLALKSARARIDREKQKQND